MSTRDTISRDKLETAISRSVSQFPDVRVLPTPELMGLLESERKIILIDVRDPEEQAVSMIPGAVTQDEFERDWKDALTGSNQPEITAVPYCTVGYRSGSYARKLQHDGISVRNSEGILMWAFEGGRLVKRMAGSAGGEIEVKQVHCYAKPWRFAPAGIATVEYPRYRAVASFLAKKRPNLSVLPWVWLVSLLYFGFTPTCGVMYTCGCKLGLSKYAQVMMCNVYNNTGPRCPFCSCETLSRASCLLVGADTKAFFAVPLLDALPDGAILTTILVCGAQFISKKIDRQVRKDNSFRRALWKTCAFTLWFAGYSVAVGLGFFVGSTYPTFLGYSRP